MGRIEEVVDPAKALEDAAKLKDGGNLAFKEQRWDDALDCYTKAIGLVAEDNKDRAIYLKNRAATLLKLEQYEEAARDCTKALEVAPNDPKALFRRCQAYEALEKIDCAYADAKEVHNLDPKNKAIEPVLVRLHKAVQAKMNELAKTSNKVKNMIDMVFNLETESDKREKAADNLIVLGRERDGADLLFKAGIIPRIVKLLKVEKDQKIRLSCIRVFGELGKKDMDRAKVVLKEAGVPFFLDALNTKDPETINAVTYVIQCILDSISRYDLVKQWKDKKKDAKRMSNEDRKQSRADEVTREEIMKENSKELMAIMHVICHNVTAR